MSLVRYYLTEILGIFWIVEKLWMMERTKIKFRVCVYMCSSKTNGIEYESSFV